MQRLGEQVTLATDTRATIDVLLEMMFYTRPVPRSYKEENWGSQVSCVRESMKKSVQLEGSRIQRGLEPRSRGIAIVKAVNRQLLRKTLGAGKDL
jgi:hypothetical protein